MASSKQIKHPKFDKWIVPTLPHDQHPTALDVVKRENVSLANKTVLVTGGTAGIGTQTVRALAAAGARIFVLARSVNKARVVLDKINAEFPQNGGLEIIEGELDSLSSVNQAANEFLKRSDKLNILVNNAGIYQVPFALTRDGYESQLAINHLSHHLLFKKLASLLVSSSTPEFHSRVITVSSAIHLWGEADFNDMNFTNGRAYDPSKAYAQSKLANIWFANHVEKLYGSRGVHGLSLNPGLVQTDSVHQIPLERTVEIGVFSQDGEYNFDFLGKDEEQGAATSVWAAISPEFEGKGGLYLDDVAIAKPADPANAGGLVGYSAQTVDEAQAQKLWEWSEKAVGKFVQD